jgi:hypothetical protein
MKKGRPRGRPLRIAITLLLAFFWLVPAYPYGVGLFVFGAACYGAAQRFHKVAGGQSDPRVLQVVD